MDAIEKLAEKYRSQKVEDPAPPPKQTTKAEKPKGFKARLLDRLMKLKG